MERITGRNWEVIVGDVIAGLRTLPDNSVQNVTTSPPYWGLRAYGTNPQIWGGNPLCDHHFQVETVAAEIGKGNWAQGVNGRGEIQDGGVEVKREPIRTTREVGFCTECTAWRGELGSEPTPELFIEHIVLVFNEVRRVLRPDGTCFVNIGDSYCSTDKWGGGVGGNTGKHTTNGDEVPSWAVRKKKEHVAGLKPKDLVGVPWMLAFALRSAGWWLRSEIIWHKRSPMPESVTDRPTKAHEQIFLFTKSESYFFDQEAVKEPSTGNSHPRGNGVNPKAKTPGKNSRVNVSRTGAAPQSRQNESFSAAVCGLVESRNIRTVWTISSESFKGAHFATFPTEIPRRAILAGTSEKGACPRCGSPWERVIEKDRQPTRPGTNTKLPAGWNSGPGGHDTIEGRYKHDAAYENGSAPGGHPTAFGNRDPQRHVTTTKSVGWVPTCDCGLEETVPCVVLDPFSGSGTTGMVATEMGRIYVGCELNPEYAEMSRKRIDSWKRRDAVKAVVPATGQRPLFE